MTKVGYADSLKQLEKISEEIHERRRKESSKLSQTSNDFEQKSNASLGTRQDGVGAEFPSPCPGDKKLKHNEVKNSHLNILSEDYHASDSHVNESQRNSDGDINDPDPLIKKAVCDEIDSMPLIGDLDITKNYKFSKSRKHKKKKNKTHQPECLPGVSLESKLQKKAISQTIKKNQSSEITQNDSSEQEQMNNGSTTKRISVSSSSTTESAGNDGTSASPSINSKNSQTSSRDSISSSSNVSTSSESPSPEQSPKLFYKRLISNESANLKSHVLSKEHSSTNNSDSASRNNVGGPIHHFENNTGFNTTDPAQKRDHCAETLNSPLTSPLKKHLYSPTKLTNRYLSIKQEESEMSDAESLAR